MAVIDAKASFIVLSEATQKRIAELEKRMAKNEKKLALVGKSFSVLDVLLRAHLRAKSETYAEAIAILKMEF